VPRFDARIGGEAALEPGATPFIEVPSTVVAELGPGKRPKVRVSFNGHTYRSTVAVYGDRFYLPVNRANREAGRVELGDVVAVTLERDQEPREVEVPPPLEAAFAAESALRARWDLQSYSTRKEYAEWLAAAKLPETKTRRLQKLLDTLR
jgi:hypothetical protein